ncbi:MAG: hypothetical protein GY821_14245 [Gammaproteobacteria bacterium]|nr:hypothetical protein [Gammaproteobacteria bacterium]
MFKPRVSSHNEGLKNLKQVDKLLDHLDSNMRILTEYKKELLKESKNEEVKAEFYKSDKAKINQHIYNKAEEYEERCDKLMNKYNGDVSTGDPGFKAFAKNALDRAEIAMEESPTKAKGVLKQLKRINQPGYAVD